MACLINSSQGKDAGVCFRLTYSIYQHTGIGCDTSSDNNIEHTENKHWQKCKLYITFSYHLKSYCQLLHGLPLVI